MSDKTIEEKFEEWIKDNAMNRLYMSDYIRAGYQIAQKEIILEIERRVSIHRFNSEQLRGTSLFKSSNDTKEHYENLLNWIKSEDEKENG